VGNHSLIPNAESRGPFRLNFHRRWLKTHNEAARFRCALSGITLTNAVHEPGLQFDR
jgi:hypothetical protein